MRWLLNDLLSITPASALRRVALCLMLSAVAAYGAVQFKMLAIGPAYWWWSGFAACLALANLRDWKWARERESVS